MGVYMFSYFGIFLSPTLSFYSVLLHRRTYYTVKTSEVSHRTGVISGDERKKSVRRTQSR